MSHMQTIYGNFQYFLVHDQFSNFSRTSYPRRLLDSKHFMYRRIITFWAKFLAEVERKCFTSSASLKKISVELLFFQKV